MKKFLILAMTMTALFSQAGQAAKAEWPQDLKWFDTIAGLKKHHGIETGLVYRYKSLEIDEYDYLHDKLTYLGKDLESKDAVGDMINIYSKACYLGSPEDIVFVSTEGFKCNFTCIKREFHSTIDPTTKSIKLQLLERHHYIIRTEIEKTPFKTEVWSNYEIVPKCAE